MEGVVSFLVPRKGNMEHSLYFHVSGRHLEVPMKLSTSAKPNRVTIDLSDKAVARGWVRKLGKSKEEIAAAIEKVGNNAETVKRELGLNPDE